MIWKTLRRGLLLAAPTVILILSTGSCSRDKSPVVPGDTTAPAAVADLDTGTVTSTSIQLTWTAPGDDGATGTATQYDIRYSTAAITAGNFSAATAVNGAPTPTAAGNAQSVTVSGLSPDTAYFFALKTADEVPNWSAISNLPTASTAPEVDVTAPAAVANLATGTVTSTSIQLTWTAPGDDDATGTAAEYDIRYSTEAITEGNFAAATAVSGAPTPTAAGSSQSVTVTGLSPETAYFFALKTADEVPNWSAISNLPTASTDPATGDVTAPAAVANLATGTVTSTSIQLTWTAPGDDGTTGTAAQYDIRWSTAAITEGNFAAATAVSGAPTPTAAGSSQSVTVSGLSPNTAYFFALKTADEVPNWSAISNLPTASTSPAGDVTAPAAVANLATGTITSTSIRLTWTAPGDDGTTGTAAQYDIRYSTAAITDGNFAAATAVSGAPTPTAAGTSQSVTVSGLSPNTAYFFALKTADEVPNWSAISNLPTASTAPAADVTAPAAVANLIATPIDSVQVALNWTAPGDDGNVGTAAQYDIRYSTSTITEGNWAAATQVTGEPVPSPAGTGQGMTVSGLHSGTTYHFAMKTMDEVPNTSALSNVATVLTPSGPFAAPGLSQIALPDSVCISSEDQWAQIAKLLATTQLGLAQAYASLGASFFAPLGNADWEQSGDCWDWTYDFTGCSYSYHACRTGSSYEYTLTLDGSCGENYDNWVAYRALYDTDARTGTFYIYEPNTTTIPFAWTWSQAADGLSGVYSFYEGDPSSAPLLTSVEWSKSADDNVADVTFTSPEDSKWVSHFEDVPCSGWLKLYQWDSDASEWWLESDIAWNADGTGYYDTYDDTGELIEHHIW